MIEGQMIQQVVTVAQEVMDAEGFTGPQPIGLVIDDFSVVYPYSAEGAGQWLGIIPGQGGEDSGFTGPLTADVVGRLYFERRVVTNVLRINFPAQSSPEYPALILTGGAWLIAFSGQGPELGATYPAEIIVRTPSGDRFSIPF